MIGPFLISIGGSGVALTIFFTFVNFFNLAKFIVEIKLITFLFFENFNLGRILFPTFGVIPKKIIEDLSISSWLFFITWINLNFFFSL